MRQNKKIIIISLILFSAIVTLQYNSLGQNLIVIHKKFSNKEYALQIGKRVKVVAFDKHKIRGRITRIKDTTMIIRRGEKITEVSIKDIRYLTLKRPWLNYSSGALLAFLGIDLITTYAGEPTNPEVNGNLYGAAILLAPACFLFFAEKRYYTHDYDLIVVKPKSKIHFDKDFK